MSNLNKFEKYTFIFGIISILLCTTILFPMILGGLGLIFSELSKEKNNKPSRVAVIGKGLCVFSLTFSIVFLGLGVYRFTTNADYRQNINDLYKQMYGVTIDEQYENMFSPATSDNNVTINYQ